MVPLLKSASTFDRLSNPYAPALARVYAVIKRVVNRTGFISVTIAFLRLGMSAHILAVLTSRWRRSVSAHMNHKTHPSRMRSSLAAAAIGAPTMKIPMKEASKGKFDVQRCHTDEASTGSLRAMDDR